MIETLLNFVTGVTIRFVYHDQFMVFPRTTSHRSYVREVPAPLKARRPGGLEKLLDGAVHVRRHHIRACDDGEISPGPHGTDVRHSVARQSTRGASERADGSVPCADRASTRRGLRRRRSGLGLLAALPAPLPVASRPMLAMPLAAHTILAQQACSFDARGQSVLIWYAANWFCAASTGSGVRPPAQSASHRATGEGLQAV